MAQVEVGGAPPQDGAGQALVPLRRNWRFQALWAGSAASMLGARMADTAYPLLLLAMTGSSAMAGAFGGVQMTASLVFGVHGGSTADRHDRRTVLIIADGVRCLVTCSIPVALWLHCLTVVQTLLVAVVIGAATAYTGPTRLLAVRSVVPKAQLRQALSQDEARANGSSLLGPPIAGFLFGVGRQAPFLGTAFGSLVAFAAACVVRFDTAGAGGGRPRGSALEGFRYLVHSRDLRPTLAVACVLNLCSTALVLPVIVLLRSHGTHTGGIGLALSGEAVGGILGALLIGRLHRLMGPGKLLLASTWICVPLFFAPLLPGGAVTVFLALVVTMLSMPALRVMVDVLIFQQVEDELRGRVVAATMMLFMLGVPAGMFGSGLLLDWFSPGATLAFFAALLAAALVPATLSRRLRGAVWPA
ncbi:MFS transporter [Streptomyces sp. SL13]|jgi:MFS family permease|uniref:MFS transporter n=1 Tax=Streptantibioticus silvisoli TaxID=2705255 RepID=A0AA90H651_9ACTN|nr:MFS transporter [Streptantibioticus silvisoli]MDI5966355.1 MFS transporter [Streptantibioticus silvisoli]MDI5974274.1 MFS transporter [Streptantibioticus silvisoli]